MALISKFHFSSIIVSEAERIFYLGKILNDTSFRGAVSISILRLKSLNQHLPIPYKMCKEPIEIASFAILTKKNYALLWYLNKKIEDLKSSGLVDYWISKTFTDKKSIEESAKVISIDDLIGTFQVLVFGVILSCSAFAMELITKVVTVKI